MVFIIILTISLFLLTGLLFIDLYIFSFKTSFEQQYHRNQQTGSIINDSYKPAINDLNTVLVDNDINNDLKPVKKITIAYIFAGAVRSFICPEVHWSIKAHLIDALGGEPHVFVRLSYEDNKNVKTGNGIILKPKHNLNSINETMKLLNPDMVESFQLTTQIEEMKKYYPAPIHTVFRENDNRRYSMFYHRCRAYRLMLQYESEHNMTFDWVVLARLDAHWLEPILPIEAYDDDRVWLTETGYSYFNDQFMLIPRKYSDYLYDLDTKVTKEVYCLGGPDVEKWKCNRTELIRRGVSEEKIASVLPYCCKDIFTAENSLGWSEKIHYRHLQANQTPVSLGRFPVALTRVYNGQCEIECFRVYAYQYKDYTFRFGHNYYEFLTPNPIWPDTKGRTISAREREICYVQKENIYPWKPISALKLHSLPPSDGYQLDYSKKLIDQLDHVHPSILRNPKDTEVWRIHPTWNTEGCLKISYETEELVWDRCVGHTHILGRMLLYSFTQLFFIYVIPTRKPADQYIKKRSYHNSVWFPETTYSTNNNISNITRLMVLISNKNNGVIYRKNNALCLTASSLKENALITMEKCSLDKNNMYQNLLTVHTTMDGSHPHSTIGQLKFAAAPHLCVSRDDNIKTMDTFKNTIIFPSNNKFFVFKCDWNTRYHQNTFEFELVIS